MYNINTTKIPVYYILGDSIPIDCGVWKVSLNEGIT